ncbi:uncharacterized protein BDV14DRAFT_111143 [Aspergillus stella-maris]|uniref:uncharacterized protein n=1 Tax=Aspergillus stella-maris TaxID=1810926 RepID=UPI003CCE37CA
MVLRATAIARGSTFKFTTLQSYAGLTKFVCFCSDRRRLGSRVCAAAELVDSSTPWPPGSESSRFALPCFGGWSMLGVLSADLAFNQIWWYLWCSHFQGQRLYSMEYNFLAMRSVTEYSFIITYSDSTTKASELLPVYQASTNPTDAILISGLKSFNLNPSPIQRSSVGLCASNVALSATAMHHSHPIISRCRYAGVDWNLDLGC